MPKRKRSQNKHINKYANNKKSHKLFIAEDTLDFHKFGEITKFDIEKILENFLEDSFINQHSSVLIITGKGKVVRPLVESLLRRNEYVQNFKTAGYFNGQQGAFEVWLKNS